MTKTPEQIVLILRGIAVELDSGMAGRIRACADDLERWGSDAYKRAPVTEMVNLTDSDVRSEAERQAAQQSDNGDAA